MLNQHTFLLDKQLSKVIAMVKSLGVVIRIGSDFTEFREISERQPLKNFVNPAFNPDHCDISATNGMWITGHNNTGEIVHTQAIKLLDLSESTLDQHFQQNLADYGSHGYDLDVENSQWFLTNAASNIQGQVTYHGELWLKGGPDGVRGGCLATLLTRLMLLMGLRRWSPDFMIGLQAPLTSCRGLAVREGYMRMEQRSILWKQFDDEEILEDWLVWMSREEAEFNLRIPQDVFYEMFEKKAAPGVAAGAKFG